MATPDYLLAENGDFLTTESGDRLILAIADAPSPSGRRTAIGGTASRPVFGSRTPGITGTPTSDVS